MTVVETPRVVPTMPPTRLYAPVARFGFAVAARAKPRNGSNRRFLLRAGAAEGAIAAIRSKREKFEDSVDAAIDASGWTTTRSGRAGHLSDFEFDCRQGVIADFTERAITRDGEDTEILMRYCVTVCSQTLPAISKCDPPSLILWVGRGGGNSPPQHSKIWVRFSCLKFRSKRLDDLSLEEMRTFHDESKILASSIKSAILEPYREVLEETLREEPEIADKILSLSTVFSIDSFTVSVADKTFPSAYRQLMLGTDLGAVPDGSEMRRHLENLKNVFGTPAEEVLPVDDLAFARGVYWLDLGNTQASLVGVANNSLSDEGTLSPEDEVRMLKSAPSNVIGILSGGMLASAI